MAVVCFALLWGWLLAAACQAVSCGPLNPPRASSRGTATWGIHRHLHSHVPRVARRGIFFAIIQGNEGVEAIPGNCLKAGWGGVPGNPPPQHPGPNSPKGIPKPQHQTPPHFQPPVTPPTQLLSHAL